MYTKITLLCLLLLLAACSPLSLMKSALSMGSGGPQLNVDAQVGDRENQLNTGATGTGNIDDNDGTINVTTAKIDTEIKGAERVTVNNGPKFWLIGLLILGWVLPTPTSIAKGFWSWAWRKNRRG